ERDRPVLPAKCALFVAESARAPLRATQIRRRARARRKRCAAFVRTVELQGALASAELEGLWLRRERVELRASGEVKSALPCRDRSYPLGRGESRRCALHRGIVPALPFAGRARRRLR